MKQATVSDNLRTSCNDPRWVRSENFRPWTCKKGTDRPRYARSCTLTLRYPDDASTTSNNDTTKRWWILKITRLCNALTGLIRWSGRGASEKCRNWSGCHSPRIRKGGEYLVVYVEKTRIREWYGPVSAIDQNVSDQRAGGNRELRFERSLHCHQPVIMCGRCHENCFFGVFPRNGKNRGDISRLLGNEVGEEEGIGFLARCN